MKLEDYKAEDVAEVLEMKQAALHQLNEIEKAIWTDDISEAANRIARLYQTIQRVRVRKNAKQDEENRRLVIEAMQKQGIDISIISMKKAD